MKVFLAVLVAVGFLVGSLLAVHSFLDRANAMPDMSKWAEVSRDIFALCAPSGDLVGVIYFDTDGDEEVDAAGLYLLDDSTRPLAVVFYEPEGDIKIILADGNRDGKVDARGLPGDPGIGNGPCDLLPV